MSTVIDMQTCPRCKHETMFIDHDCRTTEHDYYCGMCGCQEHFRFQWSEDFGQILTQPVEVLLSDLFFGVRETSGERNFLWKKHADEVPDVTPNLIAKFINHHESFGENLPHGQHNLFHKDTSEQLYRIGDYFEMSDKPGVIIHHRAQYNYSSSDGYGVISIQLKGMTDNVVYHEFTSGTSREEAQAKLDEFLAGLAGKEIEGMTATWFNEGTGKLENLTHSIDAKPKWRIY